MAYIHATIEDAPIPPPERLRSPLRLMEVGKYILITEYNREDSVRELAYQIGKQLGWKFTVRQMAEGLGVWRIK